MKVRGDIEAVNLATGQRWQRVTGDGESRLELLDAIADRVLAYRPKPKSAIAKKRQRTRRKIEKGHSNQ